MYNNFIRLICYYYRGGGLVFIKKRKEKKVKYYFVNVGRIGKIIRIFVRILNTNLKIGNIFPCVIYLLFFCGFCYKIGE